MSEVGSVVLGWQMEELTVAFMAEGGRGARRREGRKAGFPSTEYVVDGDVVGSVWKRRLARKTALCTGTGGEGV